MASEPINQPASLTPRMLDELADSTHSRRCFATVSKKARISEY